MVMPAAALCHEKISVEGLNTALQRFHLTEMPECAYYS